MTVSTVSITVTHTASGATAVFSYPFRVLESSHLKAYWNGVLQSSNRYTVAGVGNNNGGTVTFTTTPAAGIEVVLARVVPNGRTTDYTDGGIIYEDVVDADQDLQTMQAMQMDATAVKASVVDVARGFNPAFPAPVAGQYVVVNADGDGLDLSAGPLDTAPLPAAVANKLIGWNGTGTGLENKDQATLTNLDFIASGAGAVTRTAQDKMRDAISAQDFSDTQAAINVIKTNGGGTLTATGAGASVSLIGTGLQIKGEAAKGATYDFNHAAISFTGGNYGLKIGEFATPASAYKIKSTIKDINITGPGKNVAGSVSCYIDETADVTLFGGRYNNSEIGLKLNGGLICDFYGTVFKDNGTAIYARPTVHFSCNDNNFFSPKIFANTVAIDYDGPGLSTVNWIGGEMEGNNQTGTPSDGVSVFKFTNAGRHNIIGCHLEQNYGQYGIDYTGSGAQKNLLILGSEVINQSDTELKMRAGKLTAIASYIATATSTKDIDITAGATATLIDTDGQLSGDVSRVVSINYGRLAFGQQAFLSDAPIRIDGGAYYSGVAQWFKSDSTQIRFDNNAGSRISYIQAATTVVGVIGDGVQAQIGLNSGARVVVGRAGGQQVEPLADNVTTLGSASFRWSVVYAATGTINTSDGRTKQQVRDISAAEQAAAIAIKGMLKAFKFNDAVAAKGDGARIHFGVIAQDVAAAFEAQGLDPASYALFCRDEWESAPAVYDDEGTLVNHEIVGGYRLGIRYDELFAFILAAL